MYFAIIVACKLREKRLCIRALINVFVLYYNKIVTLHFLFRGIQL